jgi:2-polyprenyl-6-methoxyphenol hydroxylase-like FAD-dependent oxidoreductase
MPADHTDIRETQVLIVGAGPVGQGLAIELGQRGIRCLVVEKNPRIGVAPRAKTTNVRTREHLRRWGIADALRNASPFGVDYPSNVVFSTRLGGHLLARFENAMYCAPGRNPLYAEHGQWIPQYTVEQVMREHIATLPAAVVQLNTELLHFEQDADGVHATMRNLESGGETVVRASYLVGCDGGRSTVREAIGVRMEGTFGMSRNYNIVFRAPGLADAHPHGKAIMYWQVNGDVPCLMGPMDSDDRWFFMPTGLAPDVQVDVGNAAAMIRKATGIDLPYEPLSVDEWVAHQVVATRYSSGRVYLAGDACHLHPPFGGFGMNMGVSDAVDLGWKIAATLQGWGGPQLLASYERERRPVHLHVLKEATANHAKLGGALFEPGIEDDTPEGAAVRQRVGKRIRSVKLSEFFTLGTMLGDRYADSPVVQTLTQLNHDLAASASAAPPVQEGMRDFLNFVPNSLPGSRAPHLWLHDGSALYDHFGSAFTLLVSHTGSADMTAADIAAAQSDALRLQIPLKVLAPDTPALGTLYPRLFTLIRPDQHVAWVGDRWPAAGICDVLAMASGR